MCSCIIQWCTVIWLRCGDLLSASFSCGTTTFDIVSDFLNAQEFLASHSNSSNLNNTLSMPGQEVHHMWGTVAMIIIFLPGIVMIFPFGFIEVINKSKVALDKRNWRMWQIIPVLITVFPTVFMSGVTV